MLCFMQNPNVFEGLKMSKILSFICVSALVVGFILARCMGYGTTDMCAAHCISSILTICMRHFWFASLGE
jgi:hypothetical protein